MSKAGLMEESGRAATLTDREREIVALVCEGLSNKEIAARLFISPVTVRHHLSSVFQKLGVTSRLQLVIYAYHHRLVVPSGQQN